MLLLWLFCQNVHWRVSLESFDIYEALRSPVITQDGRLFAIVDRRSQLFALSANGKQGGIFGKRGHGPAEFNSPFQLQALTSEHLLCVIDGMAASAQILDESGTYVTSHRLQGAAQKWQSRVINANQLLFLQSLFPPGPERQGAQLYLTTFGEEPALIHSFNAQQHEDPFTLKEGDAVGMMAFAWDRQVKFAVSQDGQWIVYGPNEFVHLTVRDLSNGSESVLKASVQPIVLTAEDVASRGYDIRWHGVQRHIVDPVPPTTWPVVLDLKFDLINRIWVQVMGPGDSRPWLVFDLKGIPHGQYILNEQERMIDANADSVWVLVETDESQFIEKRALSLSKP